MMTTNGGNVSHPHSQASPSAYLADTGNLHSDELDRLGIGLDLDLDLNLDLDNSHSHVQEQDPGHGHRHDLDLDLDLDLDAIQASQLQHQLEQIHMQSPALFAAFSSSSSLGSLGSGSGSGIGTGSNGSMTERIQKIVTPALVASQYQQQLQQQQHHQPQYHQQQQQQHQQHQFQHQQQRQHQHQQHQHHPQVESHGPASYGQGQNGKNDRIGQNELPVLTPAQSSEMFPHIHSGLISPLPFQQGPGTGTGPGTDSGQGEISINERGELVFTPLLSPAVTQHGSHYPSPQFNDTSQGMASTSSSGAGDQQTQLQAIQMQQLNIQRQLDDLQRQQSHTSHSSQSPQNQAINQSQQQPSMPRNSMPPHMMQQQQHQQQQQPQGNMHTYNPHESSPYVSPLVHARADDPNSNFPTPTSEFFSPLTSPALNPVNSYGARVGVVQHRQSSSAGSRVGPTRHGRLSEGMQQTISPALLPQIDGNMINVPGLHDGGNGGGNNDQFNSNSSGSGNGSHSNDNNLTEWVNFLGSSAEVIQTPPIDPSLESRNLANSPSIMMNPGTTNGGGHFSGINSPSHPFSRSTAQERTTNGRSPSLGPHRSTASGKTRPSPMIKPTHRQNRGSGKGHISVPESPLVAAFTSSSCSTTDNSSMANKGTFIDSGTANTNGSIGSGSLSPVELSAILMPPPPIPAHVHHQLQPGPPGQALAPMTPAALMQLGGGVQAPLTLNTLAHAHAQVKKTKSTASTPATSPHTSPPTSLVGRKPSLSSKNGMSKPAEIKPRAVKPKPTTATPATAEGMNVDSTESPSSVLTLQGLDRLKMSLAEMKKADRARLIKFGTSTGSITPRAADMKLANGKGTAASASSTSKSSKKEEETTMPPEVRRSSHKAAEQKRRDSLKAGFDELRLLLPPINTEALDPESGEPIPGSSAPRLLPKSSLVPDDNPNKGVSKVALLKYSNEYIERLHAKVARRDNYIDLLKDAVVSFRNQVGFGVDEQVQELLDYQFEDEDEDEVPTGMMYPGGTAGGPKQANNDTTEDELVNLHVDGGGGGGGQWPTETEQPNDAEHQQQPPSQAQRPEKTGTGRRGSKSRPHQSNNTGSTSTVTNGNASRRKNLTSASTSTSTVVATQPSNSAASGTSSSRRNSKSKQNTVVVGDVEMA